VVISQPSGQTNAVLGGIMAVRMKVLGARGVVVDGRVRDLEELRGVGLSVRWVWFWCFASFLHG
jgi:regulator of RNase E activity RraA